MINVLRFGKSLWNLCQIYVKSMSNLYEHCQIVMIVVKIASPSASNVSTFLFLFPPREVWVQPGWGTEKENENSLWKIVSLIILVKTLNNDFLSLTKSHTGCFFNWSAWFSVPKWKNLLSQRGAFLHWKFREKLVLVGCNLFFILVLKIGPVKKTTLYNCECCAQW